MRNSINIKAGFVNFVIISILLSIATFAIYRQVLDHEFVNLDDGVYIYDNSHVKNGLTTENFIWAFSTTREKSGYLHPITWLSHMLDVQLYGMDAGKHHLTSLFIHVFATILLLLFLFRLTGLLWQSAFVAAMFALHPMHVESVAWAAERKDVLSALFGFLALLFYVEYKRCAARIVLIDSRRKTSATLYFLSLICYTLGLLSKPILVTFPAVMLLIDYWLAVNSFAPETNYHASAQTSDSRKSLCSLLYEKVPFIILSVVFSIMTIYSQNKMGALHDLKALPMLLRTEIVTTSYVKYMIGTLFPQNLAVLYPVPSEFPLWQVVVSLLIIIFICIVVYQFRKRFPYLLFGWLWFLVTLLPVIGFIQTGLAQYMADRFTYIPHIGFFIMLTWGFSDAIGYLGQKWNVRIFNSYVYFPAVFAVLVIIIYAALTFRQIGYWRNSITLFSRVIEIYPDIGYAHLNLGSTYALKGDSDLAVKELQMAIALNSPGAHKAYSLLGVINERNGDLNAAVKYQQLAIQLDSNYALAHYNLGYAYQRSGQLDEAVNHYRKSIILDPYFLDAHNNLGIVCIEKGSIDEAISVYLTAIRVNPDYVNAHFNLGRAYMVKMKLDEAVKEFQITLLLSPNDQEAIEYLSKCQILKKNISSR